MTRDDPGAALTGHILGATSIVTRLSVTKSAISRATQC
jgi:hypothetical protein